MILGDIKVIIDMEGFYVRKVLRGSEWMESVLGVEGLLEAWRVFRR